MLAQILALHQAHQVIVLIPFAMFTSRSFVKASLDFTRLRIDWSLSSTLFSRMSSLDSGKFQTGKGP
jgi:hypothetical protein